MKEAAAAVLVRHDVDRPARASSVSSESGSLELLLTLHASVGATTCGAQTGMAGLVQHATRCKRRQDGDMHAPHGRVPVKVAMSYAAGPDQRRATRVRAYFGPYPVGWPAFTTKYQI